MSVSIGDRKGEMMKVKERTHYRGQGQKVCGADSENFWQSGESGRRVALKQHLRMRQVERLLQGEGFTTDVSDIEIGLIRLEASIEVEGWFKEWEEASGRASRSTPPTLKNSKGAGA
jgi:hypothetical protein